MLMFRIRNSRRGFTIVELLIVVVVIAILAAITIVAYNGVSRSARESSIKSDLRNTATKIVAYRSEGSAYPSSLDASLRAQSAQNSLTYRTTASGFCLSGTTSASGGPVFNITEAGSVTAGACPVVWSSVATSGYFSVGVSTGGGVYTWGHNNTGSLGDSSATTLAVPTLLNPSLFGGQPVSQVAVSGSHVLALTDNGAVYGWGVNTYRQASASDATSPIRTPSAFAQSLFDNKRIKQVSAGTNVSIALAEDGTVFTWGDGWEGVLGSGTRNNRQVPTAIAASSFSNKTITKATARFTHGAALASDGTVFTWGANVSGQLGDGTTTEQFAPITIPSSAFGGRAIVDLMAGSRHTVALAADGTVFAWGANPSGQVGNGTTNNQPTPALISGGSLSGRTATRIYAADMQTFAVTSDGAMHGWGNGNYSRFAIGNNNSQSSPILIPASAFGGSAPTLMMQGAEHTLALTSNGTLYSWGNNASYQLGDGTTTNNMIPSTRPGPTQ